MAPTRPTGRNYRRKQTSNSSPEGSDRELQHPPTLLALRAPSLAHLPSPSGDLRADDISSATPERVIGDCDEGTEREAGGGRIEGEGEGGVVGGSDADREVSRSAGGFPNGGQDSAGPLTRRVVPQNGAKRIGSGVGFNMLKSMGWVSSPPFLLCLPGRSRGYGWRVTINEKSVFKFPS